MRIDGRATNQLRTINIIPDYNKYAEGSVLIEAGLTKVICTATIEERVPIFLKGQGKGWITAEYSMLPRATQVRNQRESMKGRLSGRTMEIQRLIGRALRSVVNLNALGERSITIDCDVIQADGGTRTTAITGSFVAVVFAMNRLLEEKKIPSLLIDDYLASTSVGIVGNEAVLDLCYEEDSKAKVDMNVVMTGDGRFIEVQGTGEESPFSKQELNRLLELAEEGIHSLIEIQKLALGSIGERIGR